MTWLKLSDDFDVETGGLSAEAFRLHVQGLLYVMRKETGGFISVRALRRFTEADDPDEAVRELVDHGFWRGVEDGWLIVHHMEHQPTPEQIAAKRRNDAERKARERARRMGQTAREGRSHGVSHSVTGRVTTGRDGAGRDGTDPSRPTTAFKETTTRARESDDAEALCTNCGYLRALEDGLCVECLDARALNVVSTAEPQIEEPPDLGWAEEWSS